MTVTITDLGISYKLSPERETHSIKKPLNRDIFLKIPLIG